MKRLTLLSLILAHTVNVSGNDNIPPGKQSEPLLITGATIHPVSGKPIPSGKMLIINGKIANLGGADLKINLPLGTKTIQFPGKHIYPGMISANSVLGLTEVYYVRASVDLAEPGDINPNARSVVAINPDSELIPVARANGVLATLTIPQTSGGGLIGGQSALVQLDGWTYEEMTVKTPVGMHVFWPELRTYSRWSSKTPTDKELEEKRKAYDKKLDRLATTFSDAKSYAKAKGDSDLRWEAMKPVISGKLPLFIHAQTSAQIRDLLHFAQTQGLAKNLVIVGGRDSWRFTKELAEQDIAVILSPVNGLPLRRWEGYDTPYTTAAKLHEAGVQFCIANSGSAFEAANERNLPYQAARAVAHGLPHDIGLKSVTLYPAQILGVGHRLGSLEEGKEATFFISNGDPLEVWSNVEGAYVQGRQIDLSSRHTRLYEKYQEKYRQDSGD